MITKNAHDFKRHVTSICLEINSDCNRKCAYCPHSLMERPQVTMESTILDKIIHQLEKIDYDGQICLNIYNEPLLHYSFLITTMIEIKKFLPSAQIHFSTNGDFLTKNILDFLILQGLSRLTITCHQNIFSREKAEKLVRNMLKKLKIENAALSIKENYVVSRVEYTGTTGTIPLRIFSSNFLVTGQTRANSLKNIVAVPPQYRRTKGCRRPETQVCISYDGSIYPCCMFFHGHAEKKYSIGNCTTDSIYDIYAHKLYEHFKKMGALESPYESPCRDCTE